MTVNPALDSITISVVPGDRLRPAQRSAVKALCDEAYEMDFEPFLASFSGPVHVLAWEDGQLVSHALWVTRWLQIGEDLPLRTAYVEAVATAQAARGRGLATRVMQASAEAVQDYDVAALSPSDDAFYARLGWELWQGPLFERTNDGLVASPDDEEVMIYRLQNTPALDLHRPISIEWRELEVW